MKLEKVFDYIKSTLPEESDEFYSGVLVAIEAARLEESTLLRLQRGPKKVLTPEQRLEYRRAYGRKKYIPSVFSVVKTCPTCKKEYTAEAKLQRYCKRSCSPTARERKRLSKKQGHVNAKPRWMPWSTISDVYKNRPEGMHVDHIIPLNHPDVCGLHVPWNLQYLDANDNIEKSNSWDGTYNNDGWRKDNNLLK